MTITQSAFLNMLADHLNGRGSVKTEGIDWPGLLQLASSHEVNGIIYHQCKEFVPEPFKGRLQQSYAAELFYYSNRVKCFSELASALDEAGIPFYTVKGLDVAALYPYPALRTMGDCDLLVKSEDKARAHDVFISSGFENHFAGEHGWEYIRQGLEFELHDHLLYDELGNTSGGRDFCEHAWDFIAPTDTSRCVLDWNFHYIFLLLHLHKHLIHYGIGFRQFMDLYVVMHGISLDWDWINRELERMELRAFSDRCRELCSRWFDGEEMDEIDLSCLEKVFGNGVFGFHDESNKENRRLDVIIRNDHPRWLTRAGILLGSIFPSYKNMRDVPYYSGLNGRPCLLPAFWVYRWYRAVKYRMTDNGKRMVGDALISKQKIRNREKDLAEWGL